MTVKLLAFLLSALACAHAASAKSPERVTDNRLTLELNSLNQNENQACRMTYVVENRMPDDVTDLAWQIAVFDKTGVVKAILGLEFGAISAGQTHVAVFEMADQNCADVGRIVVNDALRCAIGGQADHQACLDGLMLRNLTHTRFGL